MLLFLIACAAPSDSGALEQSVMSDDGLYTLALTFSPDPPLAGDVTITVDVPDATTLTVEGAMAGMDHGFADEPVIVGGDGHWEVDAAFTMSGTWRLLFALDGAPGADTAETTVEIR